MLLERLVPEAHAWLEARHSVAYRPELADADPADLRRAVYKAQGVVLSRKAVVTREFLDFAPMLKAVARLHEGTDNTDLEACRERRVRVIQASTANLRSNAEYLLGGLLALYRRGIAESIAGQRRAAIRLGRELHGSTVGLLGLAPSAHPLAMMLQSLGAKLVGYDPAVHQTSSVWSRLNVRPVALSELVSQSDAVAVQVLYASRYQGFINDKVLAQCKPGQVWVSTTRSDFFDRPALAAALGDGRIEAALMDAAESGFASRGSPLHDCANLYLTPRLGSHTRESRGRASWYVAQRIHETLSATSPSIFDQLPSGMMGLEAGA
ncbi:NAD(P)-binding domain-containing protein [Ramlibacter sp. XY19]|uniref:NAD(P)-dependent oxidoreductase n=1 Tax=Ramlibacter paludis TaxID=2908000 RepID=UPI0023DA27D1|nr:NAD(P)-dependent oxidoreductase [Ramlibacter paludis]MCG2592040.1 NAD(P)-binding domain-containing protein [Ramlibacter paludis]